MTLKVIVSPQTEAKLREQAAVLGEDLPVFAGILLERAVTETSTTSTDTSDLRKSSQSGDVHDFDNALDELFSGDASPLPRVSLSYSRDDIYFDHD